MSTAASNTRRREHLSARRWSEPGKPSSVLVIRMHAIGDVAITLPYCAALRLELPSSRIDFLTSNLCADMPEALGIFDDVLRFDTANRWARIRSIAQVLLRAGRNRYDVVIDLQRNWITRLLRTALSRGSWSEFDRYSPRSAGERTRDAFRAAGFDTLERSPGLPLRADVLPRSLDILRRSGWDSESPLAVLNPAGLWITRNWPLEHYVTLAEKMLEEHRWQFVLLGTSRMRRRADYLRGALGNRVLDLTERTNLADVLGILRQVAIVISEDSGLMHMAWVSGVPTLAIFGSSNHVWSGPLGSRSMILHSGDLECGACMSPSCRYGDVRCLARYSPESVYSLVSPLIAQTLNMPGLKP